MAHKRNREDAMDVDDGNPSSTKPESLPKKRRQQKVESPGLPVGSSSISSSGSHGGLVAIVDPLGLVTESEAPVSGWIRKHKAASSNRIMKTSNYDQIVELNTTPSQSCHPGEAGWIQPLRKYFGTQKLKLNRPDIWDRWAHAHWKFIDYRNRIGVFADIPSLAEYFRPFHNRPVELAERFLSFYKDKIDQGRLNIETDAQHFRRLQPSTLDDSTQTLEQLKTNRAVLKFLVKVFHCRSPARVSRICDLTIAYVVQFVRNGYKPGKGLKLKSARFAKPEVD